jgi:hypothetical protein
VNGVDWRWTGVAWRIGGSSAAHGWVSAYGDEQGPAAGARTAGSRAPAAGSTNGTALATCRNQAAARPVGQHDRKGGTLVGHRLRSSGFSRSASPSNGIQFRKVMRPPRRGTGGCDRASIGLGSIGELPPTMQDPVSTASGPQAVAVPAEEPGRPAGSVRARAVRRFAAGRTGTVARVTD